MLLSLPGRLPSACGLPFSKDRHSETFPRARGPVRRGAHTLTLHTGRGASRDCAACRREDLISPLQPTHLRYLPTYPAGMGKIDQIQSFNLMNVARLLSEKLRHMAVGKFFFCPWQCCRGRSDRIGRHRLPTAKHICNVWLIFAIHVSKSVSRILLRMAVT